MALNARLNLRQSQSMTVTPQLLQSIRLLQLTHLELDRFIDEQIEQNPLLERPDDGGGNVEPGDDPRAEDARETQSSTTDMADVTADSLADTFDNALDNVFPDDNGRSERDDKPFERDARDLPYGSTEATSADIEAFIAARMSLRDVVLEQVGLLVTDHRDRLVAYELIDALDDRGYVDVSFDDVAARLGASARQVELVLEQLQQCEPAGLFARNLAECLALQCARADRLDPAMRALLDNLELLARRDFKTLRTLCGVDEADLLDMLAEIKRLDPHPGAAFETSGSQTIIHDVSVTMNTDGSWRIELNADALPQVLVNRDYHAVLSRSVRTPQEKAFVAETYANANWLERSLEQRAQTILKVATEIVRQQDAFFIHGVEALRPMTMKMVADAISMHESTVSRVASNKYMMTPRGLFELRYFFTVALGAGGGEDSHSSEAVRERIRRMIDAEEPSDVLSDDAIVARLQKDGVDIARRTVAKYREGMGIASSVQRRREKKARLLAAE